MNELGVTENQLAEAQSFIISFGTTYISSFRLSERPLPQVKGRLLLQLAAFNTRSGSFSELDEQLESIQAADENWSAISVWALHDGELAMVAMALLSLPASEAAVERTFSAQGLVHTKLRNRLLADAVQKEMFVAFNSKPLSNKQPVQRLLTVSADFLNEADSDTDVEDDELEERKSASEESDDEMEVEEPAAAAAAAAVPLRSRSMIVASNTAFLDEYVRCHPECLSWRWNTEKDSALEAAAAEYSQKHGIATVGLLNLRGALKDRSKH